MEQQIYAHEEFVRLAAKIQIQMANLFSYVIDENACVKNIATLAVLKENEIIEQYVYFINNWNGEHRYNEEELIRELQNTDNNGRTAIFKQCVDAISGVFSKLMVEWLLHGTQLQEALEKYGLQKIVAKFAVAMPIYVYFSLSNSLIYVAELYNIKIRALSDYLSSLLKLGSDDPNPFMLHWDFKEPIMFGDVSMKEMNDNFSEDRLNMIDTHINSISYIVDTILRCPIMGLDDVTLKTIYEEPLIATNKTYTAFQNAVNKATVNKLQVISQRLQTMQFSLKEFYRKNPKNVEFTKTLYFNPYEMTDALIDRAIEALPLPKKSEAAQSTFAPNLSQFIVKDKEKVLQFIDSELSACSKPQGKLVAMIIIVLHQGGYIVEFNNKLTMIYNAFKGRYQEKIGKFNGIVEYINSRYKDGYTGDKKITDNELDSLKNKLNNFCEVE